MCASQKVRTLTDFRHLLACTQNRSSFCQKQEQTICKYSAPLPPFFFTSHRPLDQTIFFIQNGLKTTATLVYIPSFFQVRKHVGKRVHNLQVFFFHKWSKFNHIYLFIREHLGSDILILLQYHEKTFLGSYVSNQTEFVFFR